MKKQLLILCIIGGLGLTSCKHEIFYDEDSQNPTGNNNNNNNNNNNDTTGNNQPLDTMICFESQILPLFQSNCAMTGCHNSQSHVEGIRLYSYATIIQEIVPNQPTEGDVMESILEDDPDKIMPPPPHAPLNQDQIALIQQWINQGAQNTTNCTPVGCDSTAFTYSSDIAPIMSTYCNGCHSGNFPSAGINTSTHAGLQTSVSNGSLVGSVNHVSSYSAMPKNATMLDICKRTKIRKWVQAGAPNN